MEVLERPKTDLAQGVDLIKAVRELATGPLAELADDIDLDRAKAALAAAQAAGAENEAAAIRRAETRINIASVAKGLR